jgi:hypothetical protein
MTTHLEELSRRRDGLNPNFSLEYSILIEKKELVSNFVSPSEAVHRGFGAGLLGGGLAHGLWGFDCVCLINTMKVRNPKYPPNLFSPFFAPLTNVQQSGVQPCPQPICGGERCPAAPKPPWSRPEAAMEPP